MASAYQLLLRFLENNVLSELFAVLLELDFALNKLLVFTRPIHLAGRVVFEHYELVL